MSYVRKTLGDSPSWVPQSSSGSMITGFQVATSPTSSPTSATTASTPTAPVLDKGYPTLESTKPDEPCNYEGGWQLYRGGKPWDKPPGWLCQETDPDRFPDPPGWMWKGGSNKRTPWYWEKIVAKGTGPKRYYHQVIKDGVTQKQYRYTPAGQVGPAGPGPVWYSDHDTEGGLWDKVKDIVDGAIPPLPQAPPSRLFLFGGLAAAGLIGALIITKRKR